MMQPKQKFLVYSPEVNLLDERFNSKRSSCLSVGVFTVLRRIIGEYHVTDILDNYFELKDKEHFLDMMLYGIITENNAAKYYTD